MPYDTNAYLVNHVNIAISRKILITTIRFSVRILKLIKLLQSVGCVKNYIILKGRKPLIKFSILFYKHKTFYKGIRLISTQSKKFYISLKALIRLNLAAKSTIFILSTSRGLLFHDEAIRLGIGGLLLATLG